MEYAAVAMFALLIMYWANITFTAPLLIAVVGASQVSYFKALGVVIIVRLLHLAAKVKFEFGKKGGK